MSLASDAGRALGTDEIDVVMLNHAPPLMRHRAIRDGKRLVERDHDERVRLETRAILDYLDTAPLRAECGARGAATDKGRALWSTLIGLKPGYRGLRS